MLDIQFIRKDTSRVAEALGKRMDSEEVTRSLDEILELDRRRRALIQEVDSARAQRKTTSREIGVAVRGGQAVQLPVNLPDPVAAEQQLREVEAIFNQRMMELPNLPADDVIAGGKDKNRELRRWGARPTLEKPTPHWEIATRLDLVDFRRGASLSGSGFWIYTGIGALLEWSLISFLVSENVKAGYTMMMPPHLVLPAAGHAAGQFPKFTEDVYHTTENSDLFLIPTAETAITGAYRDEIFTEQNLPFRVFAYTPCYRRERAGAHSDERGTVRGHQFNKVECFQFVTPEQAATAFELMVTHVEGLLAKVGLHHRTSLLAAQDTSASMRKTIDIEVWMPSINAYKEVSSVSWAGDYQARRANIRYHTAQGRGTQFVHTLNGSALATSRLFPAILEQYQLADGSVLVPEVLRPYLSGLERIELSRKT